MPQPIHTSPGPAQNPHTLTQPTADDTTQPKPRSNSHYGTEFLYTHYRHRLLQDIMDCDKESNHNSCSSEQ